MEFKTRVGMGALTGAGETGGQFAWQDRPRQRECTRAGSSGRMNARTSIATAGRAGSCWRALESAALERGGGIVF